MLSQQYIDREIPRYEEGFRMAYYQACLWMADNNRGLYMFKMIVMALSGAVLLWSTVTMAQLQIDKTDTVGYSFCVNIPTFINGSVYYRKVCW